MSGSVGSAFPSENTLFSIASGGALRQARNDLLTEQHNQQLIGQGDTEMAARIAQTLVATNDDAKAAELYPGFIREAQGRGFLKNAPLVWPGMEHAKRVAALGTSSAEQYKLDQQRQANNLAYPGPGGAPPGAGAATGGGTASGGGAEPDYSVPRGIRNNNPLNLSFANQPGATMENHPNPRFARFGTPEEGVAAAVNQLKLYQSRGNNTLRGMISTWAPPSENDTEGYIKHVAQVTGLNPDAAVNLDDPAVASKLVQAMARHETGRPLDAAVADRGIANRPGSTRVAAAPTQRITTPDPETGLPVLTGGPPAAPVAPAGGGRVQVASITPTTMTDATPGTVAPLVPPAVPAQQQAASTPPSTPMPSLDYTPQQQRLIAAEKMRGNDIVPLLHQFQNENIQRQKDWIAQEHTARTEEATARREQRQIEATERQIAATEAKLQQDARDGNLKTDKQQFDKENTLRDEFGAQTAGFRVIQGAYENIRSSSKVGDGASDMSMLYSYIHLLDPTTGIKESEFSGAAASGSWGDKVKGAVNTILTGGRLSDNLRQNFVRESKNLYENARKGHDVTADQYEKLATKYGLDPERVVTRFTRPQEDVASSQYTEGQTATAADGHKLVFRNGSWGPL